MTSQFTKSIVSVVLTITLSGCVTTGNEDVNAVDYKDFNLGPSSLEDHNVAHNENTTSSTTSTDTEINKQSKSFSAQQLAPLPQVSGEGIALLQATPKFADDDKQLSVSVNEMSVTEFIHHIYGDLLELDYAISPKVEQMREKVVLRLQNTVTSNELYQLSGNLLKENGIAIASKDNILYFQKENKRDKANKAVGIGREAADIPNAPGVLVQLVPYIYNSSGTIRRIIGQLTNVKVSSLDEQKLLIIEGTREEIMRAMQIVNMLDVPSAKGRDIRYLTMVYTSPDEMINLLTEVLKNEGVTVGGNGDIAIVPVTRQNAMIVYASSNKLGRRVVEWAKTLDKPEEGAKSRFYIYRPKFSKAENIHEALSQFISGGTGGGLGGNAPTNGAEKEASGKSNNSIAQNDDFKIAVDSVQNSLLIQATPQQYHELLTLLEQLDQLPPQVALDVAIAEFDISDNFTAGISKLLIDSSKSNDKKAVASFEPFNGSFSLSGLWGVGELDFSLIAEKAKARVLSRPYLVVQDGESASITAGKQVPVQTGSNTSDGGNTTVEIQYRSTGVSLNVTPTINADGLVSLIVSQSVSSSEPGPADLNPIITDRSLNTAVLVGNGQTAILGGLIQNNEGTRGNSVPFFSDLPLIGDLFKTKADTFSRSELVIMITPKILKNTTDLDDFTNSVKEVFTIPVGKNLNEISEKESPQESEMNKETQDEK
ncbi:general secretion pathway protein D [Aliivibrio wodanis]|uniref:General secretion pathway protein D n=1 Tax=Aliivibrio wodanis TaxID=80852 RepID=A0A090IIG1_9GAMM|nr:general secretion pathway protein D [Aliivibrio wodanis]